MLVTNPTPPQRLRNEIYEDMVFPYHATVDRCSKLGDVLEYKLHPLGNSALCDSLLITIARSVSFYDARSIYFNVKPIDQDCAVKENTPSNRSAIHDLSVPYNDLREAVKVHLFSLVQFFFCSSGNTDAANDAFITDILTQKCPAFDRLKAEGAISEELGGILDVNAVKRVLADTVPQNAIVVGTRKFLSIKEYETEEELWKARILVLGCMDREFRHMASDADSVAPMSLRTLSIIGFSLGYEIRTRDLKQAYLQGGQLTRKIFARPPNELRERLRG